MHPADLTIAEAGARLRSGAFTSADLADAHLARIEERDGTYRAFATITAGRARDDAARADRELQAGHDRGPLHGIPIALKDIIDTAGIRTTCGSRVFRDRVPAADAEVARRLREAGAVLLGKVQTYEFAVVGPSDDLPRPPATNPWNPAHITGGSSSGSAAAVAGGMVRVAIGSDTGGSIRSPASYTGIVGLKPTKGRVPKQGVFPLSPSLDHVGPLAATVAEAALTFDVIADPSSQPTAARDLTRGVEGLRIGYARNWFTGGKVDPAIVDALDEAASTLSMLGARIEPVAMPDYALLEAAGAVILHAEAFAVHRDLMRDHAGEYGRLTYQSLMSGLLLDDNDVELAHRVATALGAEIEAVLGRYDAIITANTLSTALPFSAFDGRSVVWTEMRTLPFNLTGHPVLALPVGHTGGLPIGMQVIGRMNDETTVCRVGAAFEGATDHALVRPPGLVGRNMDAHQREPA